MHWTWLFIEKATGRCKVCEEAGKNHMVKCASATNNTTHLVSIHKLTEASDAVKEEKAKQTAHERQPAIDKALVSAKQDKEFLDYMLIYAVPISRTEDALFRSVHPSAPNSRKTLRQRLTAHATSRYDEALAKLKGRTVTLAVDAGTIWNKYLCVVALAYKSPPLVVACEHAAAMPTAWVEATMTEVIKKLTSAGVTPVGLVADNASNMQATLRKLPLLAQRCLAHSIQLCVEDVFKQEPFEGLWVAVKTVLRDSQKPEPPATRWSGKYLCMKDIVESDKYIVGGVDNDDFQAMLPASRALKPFFVATQHVQGNGATMVTASSVVYSLLHLEARDTYARFLSAATKKRIDFLVTDAVLVTTFFHPGVKRANIAKAVKERVFAVVRSVFKEVAGEEAVAEWTRLRVEPPRSIESNVPVNTADYVLYWAKSQFPNLTHGITRVVEGNPTEAECERAFSSVKFSFPRLRSSSSEDLVESTTLGASAVASLRGFKFEGAEPEQCAEEVDDRDKVNVAITGDQAVALLTLWDVAQGQQPEPARRRRVESELCGECRKVEHPEGTTWVKCTTCATWFAFCCVGIAEEDKQRVEDMLTWTCQDCHDHF